MTTSPVLSLVDAGLMVLALTNLAAFSLFWFDKRQARVNGWRVPERNLLFVALLGGFGAWMGQHLLRHKTRKEPFRTTLGIVLATHVVILAGAAWWLLAPAFAG